MDEDQSTRKHETEPDGKDEAVPGPGYDTTMQDITIAIAGSGGDGIVTAGDLLVAAGANEGLYCFMTKSFGPQIRGGESSCKIRMSQEQVLTPGDTVDVLVVFSWNDLLKFKNEIILAKGGHLIFDEEAGDVPDDVDLHFEIDSLGMFEKGPLTSLSEEATGSGRSKNIVLLGVLSELYGLPSEGLEKALIKKIARKHAEVLENAMRAVGAGRKYARDKDNFRPERTGSLRLHYEPTNPKLIMSGNEAIAYGAMFGGCRFVSAYPITPSSEVFEWLHRYMPRFGGDCIQAEDEIAAMAMVVGASFAGKKAMTATSGPGVSLMSELIGLAAISELPCVIVNVQRAGPSTGIPTKMEQSDLQQALFGTHGDAPRVVIAPADVEDCFDVAVEAFYIAEKYQIPVIILSDQFIGHRKETVRKSGLFEDEEEAFTDRSDRAVPSPSEVLPFSEFARYKDTESGVSPATYPGIPGGEYTASGIAHDEKGRPTSVVEVHDAQNAKRFRKFEAITEELQFIRRYGPKDANVGVIAWGSSKGAVKEAIWKANAEGHRIAGLVPQIIYPIPAEKFQSFISKMKKVIVIELSYSHQFLNYLRAHLDLPDKVVHYKRSGGMPLSVGEVYDEILKACPEDNELCLYPPGEVTE